ncbi:Protein SZT2, partial [Stegodyphus mimosarum]
MMLSRNPQCMLTPEDVQFIQNPNSPPTQEIHFTLPVKLLGYAHSVHIYLRQNMLHFVYNPKYTDSRKESHFKAYSYNPVEWTQVDDNDIFLYHSHQASGYSGGKGISCIVLSLVTGSGTPFQNLNNLSPNPSAYQDGLSENEFKDLTCTSVYTVKKDKSPGPVALIRFQIWSVGKDVKQQIELKLENAVRHALWDLLMEYCALTSPISDSAYLDDSSCYSEPTTPIRTRRTGLSTVDPNLQLKDFHSSVGLQISKEMSSSVPDITVKAHSPPSLKEIPAFKFGNGPQSAKPEFHTEGSNQAKQITPSSSTTKSDKKNLNYMFHTLLEPFLQYGDKLGCPALSRGTFTLSSRHSVIIVLKEIQTIIKNILRDIFPKVYLQINDPLTSEIEYIPFNPYTNTTLDDPEDRKPGSVKSFIIIGRNEKQWRAYMGHSDFLKFHESSVESIKTYQKYQTHVCTRQNLDTFQESGLNSPTHANKSITSASPHQKSSAAYTSDRSSKSAVYSSFVPRQRLFRMYVQDKEITLFLYNWSSEISQNLLSQLTKLVKWHQQRNCLLNNIILQKLGVFHGLSSLQRASAEKSTKADKSKSVRESPDDSVKLSYIEQLISNHNFSKESHSTSSKSSTVSLKPVYVSKSLKNARPIIPFHLSSSADVKDPVKAHGTQFLETISAQRRDMQVLYNMWQTR